MLTLQEEAIRRIQEKIDMRAKSTRTDKEREFGEMMIYEDAIRIINQSAAYISNVNSGRVTV